MTVFGIINIVLASISTFCEIRQLIQHGESDVLTSVLYLACAICLTVIS